MEPKILTHTEEFFSIKQCCLKEDCNLVLHIQGDGVLPLFSSMVSK